MWCCLVLLHSGYQRVGQEAKDVLWRPVRRRGVEGEDAERAEANGPEELAGGDDVDRAFQVAEAVAAEDRRVDVADPS